MLSYHKFVVTQNCNIFLHGLFFTSQKILLNWVCMIKKVNNHSQNYLIMPILILFQVIFLLGCQSLPNNPRTTTSKYTPTIIKPIQTQDQTLIKKISQTKNPKPTEFSGYFPIITSGDAFASRSLLTELSQKTIDVQYYIWHNDTAGQLMLKDLYLSAQRGVKIRLLLDDLATTPDLDQQLLVFDSHPNIEVRLINPKVVRSVKSANFFTALPRYHRRMHNKSMTFDGQLSIIGGRNIGNEYLRSDTDDEFADVDVLLAGNVVKKIEQSFEQYWESPLSYDVATLVSSTKQTHQHFLQGLSSITQYSSSKYLFANNPATSIHHLIVQGKLPFRWAKIDFFADNVKKLLKKDDKNQRLVHQLREAIGTPKQQFTIVSSYFVPTKLGVQQLSKLSQNGVTVSILTNSYDSTDVPIVHSGYSENRLDLLKAGVHLYELKSDADPNLPLKKRHLRVNQISTSLHTKAFAVDDRVTFIGSYNLDPRSANINTELGVLIYDPILTRQVHQSFHQGMLNISYRLRLVDNQKIIWETSSENDKQNVVNHSREPNQSLMSAVWIKIFSLLPIEWLL